MALFGGVMSQTACRETHTQSGSDHANDPVIPARTAPTLRILFAGGCHVGGYPLDPSLAFSALAVAELQREFRCETSLINPVSLINPAPVLAECKRFSPDILILQLGHYTSGIWLRKRFDKMMRRGKTTSSRSEVMESSSSSAAAPSAAVDP